MVLGVHGPPQLQEQRGEAVGAVDTVFQQVGERPLGQQLHVLGEHREDAAHQEVGDLFGRVVLLQRLGDLGLAFLIDGTPGYRTVGAFASMEEALEKITKAQPEIALCDIELPGMSGIEGVRILRTRLPDLQILMLTVFADNDHVFEAICAGASGYLLKDTPPARLVAAIRELHEGGAPMSPEIARKVVAMFSKVVPPKHEEHRLSARPADEIAARR